MKTEPLPRDLEVARTNPPDDIQMLVHSAWLLAGIAIALAACTGAPGKGAMPEAKASLGAQKSQGAWPAPAANATSGNVQDMTY
jgi:hypothetical protein